MRCANCLHSRTDHATGRCGNRTDRLHRESGVSVVTVCGCKRYEDEVAVAPVVAAVEPVAVVEAEPEQAAEPEEVTEAEPPPTRTRRSARMEE